jgi:alkylhydroperoxidase family enzyme
MKTETTPPTKAQPATPAATDPMEASRQMIRGFGKHYDYDTSYLEELMDTSPAAWRAFEAAMPMARVRQAAPVDLMMIAKLAAMHAQDCGPCTVLNVKMAREAGLPEATIRAVLKGGTALEAGQRDVFDYARAVSLNEPMDPELLPRLREKLGAEVLAELAVNILSTKLYPTIKRALGHDQSCALMPELAA